MLAFLSGFPRKKAHKRHQSAVDGTLVPSRKGKQPSVSHSPPLPPDRQGVPNRLTMPPDGNHQPQPRTKRSLPSAIFSSSKQPASRNDRYQIREQEWDPYPNDSPPRTPPAQSPQVMRYRNYDNDRSQNNMAAPPGACRETFLDDINAFDNTGTDDSSDDRDMHDLSLSPKHVTRASVVDNMLLSFDQFSNAGPSLLDDPQLLHRATHVGEDYEDDDDGERYEDEDNGVYRRSDRYPLNSRFSATKLGRHRGHTFSSSLSSEVDIHGDDNQGRYSAMSSRGRRSNSSSNQFQPGLRRIDSLRDGRGAADADILTERGRVSETQRAMHPSEKFQNNQPGRRVPKASRSAVTSGVDFPHPIPSGRQGQHSNGYHARRSTSLDGISRQRQQFNVPIPDYDDAYGTTTSGTESPHYGHTAFDMDAAPTPTVPVGPRRERSPPRRWQEPSATQYPATSPNTPALSRRNSTKSSRSAYKKGRSDTLGTSTIRGRNNGDEDFIQFRDSLREAPPPMPAVANPSAPSPTVSYQKPALPQVESTPTPPKERPGFFRRVFGSSKNSSPSQAERRPTQQQYLQDPSSSRENDTAPGCQQSSSTKSQGTGVSSADNSTAVRDNPPVVTKKPSSFFRRRKKSFVDHNPPPPLILPQQAVLKPNDQFKNPEPSPVSSLRKIMTPYLANPSSSTSNAVDAPGAKTEKDIAPHGWPQSDDADPASMGKPSAPFMAEGAQHKNSSKYSLNLELPSREHDSSFLADSSGNEGPSSKSSLRQGANGQGGSSDKYRRPKTSPVAPSRAVKASLENSQGANLPAETDENRQRISQSENPRRPSAPNPSLTVPEPSRVEWDSKENLSPRNKAAREGKGWLDGTSSEEHIDESSKISLPIEGASNTSPRESISDVSHYQTAENTPNIPSNATPDWNKQHTLANSGEDMEKNNAAPDSGPSAAEREQAQKIYDNQEEPESDDTAAAWLGNPDREMVRKAYMELFDWSNMNILAAMRSLCSRIALKGETQQVDRILDSFSSRWCGCNPNHGFKATDVVHTICYSVLLLNTDLHLADIESKMTRNQFIRNTMPTIHRVVTDAAPNAFETIRGGNSSKYQPQTSESTPISAKSPTFPLLDPERGRGSLENDAPNKRFSRALEMPTKADASGRRTPVDSDPCPSASGPLVSSPFSGTIRAWEVQIEIVLKEFYNSIQKQRLPLYGAPAEGEEQQQQPQQQSNNLLSLTGNMLRRAPSTLSKNGSEVYPRGRVSENRLSTARFSSKPRSRAKLYPNSNVGSSRTSLDDQSSVWSPAASSTWSRYSLGKTLTSVSVDSFGSEYPRGDYQQSVGFANALSQAIIREDPTNTSQTEDSPNNTPLLEDESLQLAGAPWAKEGSLKHKHHLDSVDKRAKDRNWNECFAVIQQGWMRLFSFSASSRQKPKQRQNNGGRVVGGGNWMENAEEIWNFLLRQTIASALPPPGYSKSRPHVWALSLPTGAVHLFQVGTPEIVKEFVSTANYWSARLSKEPLFGGISNIEYGWSDAIINGALITSDTPTPSSAAPGARPSLQSSIRSSLDQQGVRPKLPADRVHITDWSPPQQSMMASNIPEAEQLKALQAYVKNVEDDLKKHNELRSAMALAFSPRHPNSAKALANWERKSAYLLREIVKFRTYIDCLKGAQEQKEKLYGSTASTSENFSPFTPEDENALDRPRANSVSV